MLIWFWVWFFKCNFCAWNYFWAHFEMVKKQVPRQNHLFKSLLKELQFLKSPGSFLLLHIIPLLSKRDELSECKAFDVINMSCTIFHVSVTWLNMKMRVAGSGCDSALHSLGREVLVYQNLHSRRSSKKAKST